VSSPAARRVAASNPLAQLADWIEEARVYGVVAVDAASLATVNPEGRPSATIMTIKRVESRCLIFTSALWTREAQDLEHNNNLALTFNWPELGRRVSLTGTAELAPRLIAETLFRELDLSHQIQTHVSRQGEPIDDLASMRRRADDLLHQSRLEPGDPLAGLPFSSDLAGTASSLDCPEDWGAFLVTPTAIEFWIEAADRLHDRLLYVHEGGAGASWQVTRLAP
jgi:pyridoxamine 5'-phosphate oxidase